MYKWRCRRGSVPTHTLMDGGVLSVPTGKLIDFHNDYISEIKNGTRLFVIELKTPKFKFFMDIDYAGRTALCLDDVITISKQIHSVIQGECILATAAPKRLDDTTIKSGIHLYWPDLIVDKTRAMELSEIAKSVLDPSVSEFVDNSVYKGSGIRMVWSHKKGRSGDEGPYVPVWDVHHDRPLSDVPSLDLIQKFSIQVGEVEGKSVASPSMEVDDFINSCVSTEKRFKGILATHGPIRVRRFVSNGSRFVTIQTMSKFCMNICREHKSNHVYFVADLDHKTIRQRCHDEGCSKYQGLQHRIPPDVFNEIIKSISP